MKISKSKAALIIIPAAVIVCLLAAFFIYTSFYYRADSTALQALVSDERVTVTQTDYGWFFDGSSEENALMFYPGAKVEETAYAPFLRKLAENGMDVCLVKMPFHLALFGEFRATFVMEQYDYDHWYIGGHSLGGSMAANYVASQDGTVEGLVLCASYPVKKINDDITEIMIYGSEDKVLNMKRLEESRKLAPEGFTEYIIEGGNHAGFGNYGAQDGDGAASISPEMQQDEAVEVILRELNTV